MTPRQREVAQRVARACLATADAHYRAEDSGERVTLASLYRAGVLDRRAWRGRDGEADAAYEYRPSVRLLEEILGPTVNRGRATSPSASVSKMTAHEVIAAFESIGFVQAGHTRVEHVRIPTKDAPVLGGAGGARRALGGRVRLTLPRTDLRATIGGRATFLYRQLAPRSIEQIAHLDTPAVTLEELRRLVNAAVGDHMFDSASNAGLLHDDVPED